VSFAGVPTTRREARAVLDKIQDIVWFCQMMWPHEPVWSRQEEALRSFVEYDQVAWRSGHKTSKSNSLAKFAIWWVCRGVPGCRVALTSSGFGQVKNILWREIRRLKLEAAVDLGGTIYLDPFQGWQWTNNNQVFGFSTDEVERAAGFSAPHLVYLIDEASGVPEDIFEAMFGNLAGGGKMIMTSQGTKASGVFFDAFHTKSHAWHKIHTPSTDSPNVTGECEIPGLATTKWIDERRAEWGADSLEFQIRVLGNFPGQAANAIIGLSTVMEAISRHEWIPDKNDGALRIGVDVARYGDDESVITVVRGLKVVDIISIHSMDGLEVAGHTLDAVQKHRYRWDDEIRIKVDVIGLGASPSDFLNHMERGRNLGIKVSQVNVQNRADDEYTYSDLRTQLCFALNDWLKAGGAIPQDDMLMEEMFAPTYTFDARGRRKLESKDKEKKLLKRSPDRRNSLELAVYETTRTRSLGAGTYAGI